MAVAFKGTGGYAAGDLLIQSFQGSVAFDQPNVPTSIAGWNLAYYYSDSGSTAGTLYNSAGAIFWRVAGSASEAGITGSLSIFSGADPSDPIGQTAETDYTLSSFDPRPVSFSPLTTTRANSMVFVAAMFSRGSSNGFGGILSGTGITGATSIRGSATHANAYGTIAAVTTTGTINYGSVQPQARWGGGALIINPPSDRKLTRWTYWL